MDELAKRLRDIDKDIDRLNEEVRTLIAQISGMPLPPALGNSLEKNENLRKTPLKKLTKEE